MIMTIRRLHNSGMVMSRLHDAQPDEDMSRTFSEAYDPNAPHINRRSVIDFFTKRAQKAELLGNTRAVIYQDANPELAERRDAVEKKLIAPKLQLSGHERVLDIGCGTGRWTDILGRDSSWYHGIDISDELVAIAHNQYATDADKKFTTLPVDELSLHHLNESKPFDRVFCIGVLMYLNDDELQNALHGIVNVTAPDGLFLLREPIGLEYRLTIKNHYSEEMEQTYNAIYRTETELMFHFSQILFSVGFSLLESGDVYSDEQLNNRAETRQRWFLFRRIS